MRAFVTFVAGLATAAIVAAVGIVALQNQQGERLTFLGATVVGTAGLDVAAGAALGCVAALFLLLPGQVASALRAATLGRKLKALEGHGAKLRGQLETLRLDHTRLQDDYRCLQDEAGRLRSAVARLAGPSAAAAIAAAPGRPAKDTKEGAAAGSVLTAETTAPDTRKAVAASGGGADKGAPDAAKGDDGRVAGQMADRNVRPTNARPAASAGRPSGRWARVKAKIKAIFGGESADEEDGPAREPEWRRKGERWQA